MFSVLTPDLQAMAEDAKDAISGVERLQQAQLQKKDKYAQSLLKAEFWDLLEAAFPNSFTLFKIEIEPGLWTLSQESQDLMSERYGRVSVIPYTPVAVISWDEVELRLELMRKSEHCQTQKWVCFYPAFTVDERHLKIVKTQHSYLEERSEEFQLLATILDVESQIRENQGSKFIKEDELIRINFEEVSRMTTAIQQQMHDFILQHKPTWADGFAVDLYRISWVINGASEFVWSFSPVPSVERSGVKFYERVDGNLVTVEGVPVRIYGVRVTSYEQLKELIGGGVE